jgi:hypothetical protein
MKQKIEEFLKQKATLTEMLKKWVVDKTVPLSERWEVFVMSDLGERAPFMEEFDDLDMDDLARIRDFNKFEVVDLTDINSFLKGKHGFNSKRIARIQEQILEKFIQSFEFDW